jgi:carbon-monoxide dehydrogenase medium subunit
MQPFTYHAPATVSEALDLLASTDGDARPLAGGTDLLVQMRRHDRSPGRLIDVKRIPELREIRFNGGGRLRFGAAVTCAELCEHEDVAKSYPGLLDAVRLIGGTAVQGRATVGGNLCNAAPSADGVPALIVLTASCVIASPRGKREIPAGEFCVAPGKTLLADDELLVALCFPAPASNSAGAYLRFTPRGEMDIAVAGVAAWLRLDGNTIAEARVALSAVAPTPLPVPSAGALLAQEQPTETLFAEAGRIAAEACSPITDHRGSEAQRRHLVGVLTRRCLMTALDRARKGAVG